MNKAKLKIRIHIYQPALMRPAPADATLRSGGGRVKILGYGTVIIRPEPVNPGGDVKLTLSDVDGKGVR